MKIKEFSITRYGPLRNTGRVSLAGFNLFWGKNEEGKTLTIDALVKLLLGRGLRDFERIDRVEENPEGYVIILDDKGTEIKLPEKGTLTKVAGLSPSECRNIFVIRNSDLSIACESEFYTNVTDRLTGLRTQEISRIRDRLREIGKITPTGTFRDVKDEKLKARMESAKDAIEKIEALSEQAKQQNFDQVEEKVVTLAEHIEATRQQLDDLEDAAKREKCEKTKEALVELKRVMEKLEDLEIYSDEDVEAWRDSAKDAETLSSDRDSLFAEAKKKEEELKKTRDSLGNTQGEFRVLDERKKKIDNEIKPELKNYEIKAGELKLQEKKSSFFGLTAIIAAVLLGIGLLGVIFSPSLLICVLTVLFLVIAGVGWIIRLQFVRNKAWLAGAFERIRLDLARFKLAAENIEGILSSIQEFGEEHSKKDQEIGNLRAKETALQSGIEELREKAGKVLGKIKKTEEKIDVLKAKSKDVSLQEYRGKLTLKKELQRSHGEQSGILRSLLGWKGRTLEENISFWDAEVKDLEHYEDKAKDIKYDEKRASKLKGQEKSCKDTLDALEREIGNFKDELGELEKQVNRILEAGYLHCKTSVDLAAVTDKLREFLEENEAKKEAVLKVISIFDEIEAEEKEKVSELFGKDSPVSNLFSDITEGRYEEVLFDRETSSIKVSCKDGTCLEAQKLSGGAYDQLYLSIRLVLGQKLLKGKKAFFIMDDPFVKADPDRLERQIETLKKVSALGWQVIYFSAKGEIKDALAQDIQKGDVNHIEIPGAFP